MFRRGNKPNGGSQDAAEEGVVYYDGSQQQQQPQALYHEDRHDPQAAYGQQQQQQTNGTSPKKKKKRGLGARIRGMVKRKKKRRDSDGESVDGSQADVSVYSYDDGHGGDYYGEEEEVEVQPLNDVMPNSALDPNIMSRIVEEEEEEMDSEEESPFNRSPVKAKSNHMISKKARELPMDSVINDTDSITKQVSFKGAEKTPSVVSMDSGSLSVVVLLVDPKTLRFELLQLDFPTPKEATVLDILGQIQDPFWRPLPFVGVIDRKGNAYKVEKKSKSKNGSSSKRGLFGKKQQQLSSSTKSNPSMEQVCQHRVPRKSKQEPHRDVLVALLKDATVEKTHQLARPILGEQKVVAMLEQNGYNLEGWKSDKQREATLQKSRILPNNTHGKRSSVPRFLIALLVIAAVVAGMIASGVSPTKFDPRTWNVALPSKASIPSLRDKLPNAIPLFDKFRSSGATSKKKKPSKPAAAPIVLTSNEDETVEL